jgi:uncharacterized protein GlcG (DUF336 family)
MIRKRKLRPPALMCLVAPFLLAASKADDLTEADVRLVIQKAAESIDSASMVIAVTNRQGDILGVFRKPGAPALSQGNFGFQVDTNELAVSLARTGGFFSNNQAPLSSRTVRFISGVHFPPGISFTGNADLYGIENTNRGCFIADPADFAEGKRIPPATSIDGTQPGLGITTGKPNLNDSDSSVVNPGGVPLFKNGALAGGLGVAGVPPNVAEYAAYTGGWTAGFLPSPPPNDKLPEPQVVIIGGIALPFVNQQDRPAGVGPGTFSEGTFVVQPRDSPGPAPDGDLIEPRDGSGGLSKSDVRRIIDAGIATANVERAVIRLPSGSRARFVFAVADLDGTIIGLNRMPDATIFSIDVAVAKSRNVIYFSSADRKQNELPGVPINTAVTNRTISFGAQPFYPPGIDYSTPGPFFDLYKFDTLNPCTQGDQPSNGKQNGIVFFPGSLPLYKNGKLVGGLGVSGDGVDQDDFATAAAAVGFEPPAPIRADRVIDRGVRLPYLKFPRNPTN